MMEESKGERGRKGKGRKKNKKRERTEGSECFKENEKDKKKWNEK